MRDPIKISIIIPCRDEVAGIEAVLRSLAAWQNKGDEVIVVDASGDGTADIAARYATKVVSSPPGRARQMNVGAGESSGSMLLFLHADTELPYAARDTLLSFIDEKRPFWGRFDLTLSGKARIFRVIEALINRRSRWSKIATGDQAIFVEQGLFNELGGYADLPLMEDIDLSRRLKQRCPPHCLSHRVITSSRRWETNGIIRTIMTMWCLRAAYALGVPAKVLVRFYY